MRKKNPGDNEIAVAADGSRIVAIGRGVPPELMAIGSMVCVQLGAALAVPVMAAIGPATTTALRLFWSGILLALFVRPRFSRLTPRQWLGGASLGVVIATMTICYFVAISRIPMGPATAIEFLGPLGVALIGARKLIHLVLAIVAGIGVFLLTRENARWSVDVLGVGFAAAAALGWAAYILLMKRVGAAFPGLQGLSIALMVAAVAAIPVSFVTRPNVLAVAPFVSTIGLAVLTPLLPYALEMMALRKMSTRAFGIFMSMEPAISAVLGFVILAQRLSLRQISGIGCVVLASAITAVRNKEDLEARKQAPDVHGDLGAS
ncbi:MAG TPA: EamA family transporter [Chthoniobacterales bacterium]|nr:EamA family transporter [Chthoniobacterales bacterium]